MSRRIPIFKSIWYLANVLLIASFVFLAYAFAWEYSTERYLKGFSDAIAPFGATAEQKVEAILFWMAKGPARENASVNGFLALRNPEKTLNGQELLRICGTATNAFVNLANSSGVPARRLLFMDRRWRAKHVVAEVNLGGRWIVVAPALHVIFRDASGNPLTKDELTNPATFQQATQKIPGYNPAYNFTRTAHVRLTRIPLAGALLRKVLGSVMPDWTNSIYWTLFLERESLVATACGFLAVAFFFFVRVFMRWCGVTCLGIRRYCLREHLVRAGRAFMGRAI